MTIILPIQPKFSRALFSGEKKFEYRRKVGKLPVDKIIIYETSPTQQIVGEVTVTGILKGSPNEIWQRTKNFSGISESFFFSYFTGKAVPMPTKLIKQKNMKSLFCSLILGFFTTHNLLFTYKKGKLIMNNSILLILIAVSIILYFLHSTKHILNSTQKYIIYDISLHAEVDFDYIKSQVSTFGLDFVVSYLDFFNLTPLQKTYIRLYMLKHEDEIGKHFKLKRWGAKKEKWKAS